jgi:hypothetical protein
MLKKTTIRIHAPKSKIDSLLGIKYVFQKDRFRITAIHDSSIFKKDGHLRIGHEVVEVNGTSLAKASQDQVRTLLASLGDHVTFVVKATWSAKFDLQIVENGTTPTSSRISSSEDISSVAKRARFVKNFNESTVPHFLEGLGVPMRIWQRIYHALDSELLPAVSASYRMDEIRKQEMYMYSAKQGSKDLELFSQGAKHEGKVFRMTQTSAALANSATLIATNVLVIVNALIQPYGLMCNLDLQAYELPKYSETKQKEAYQAVRIQGIEFIPIDHLADEDEFTISYINSCTKSEDGSVLTEPDTTRWC